MGGVDKHDMLRQLYGVNRKSMKWWHQLFFSIFDMTIANAYVQFKESKNECISLLNFQRELAQELFTLGQQSNRPGSGAPKRRKSSFSAPVSVGLNNLGMHWPQFLPEIGRGEVCSQNGVESRLFSIYSHCGTHRRCNSSKMCFSEERQKTQNSVNTEGGRYKVQKGIELPRQVSTLLKGLIRR